MDAGQMLVKVAAFTAVHEAYLGKSVLEAAGIEASVADEHLVSMNWTYSNAIGGVKVLVPEDRLEEARSLLATPAEVLDTWQGEGPDADQDDAALPCPSCRTGWVASILRDEHFAVLSWLVTGIPLGSPRRRRYCRRCGRSVGPSSRPA